MSLRSDFHGELDTITGKLLRDDQRKRIQDLLPGEAGDSEATGKDNQLFVEAVPWIAPLAVHGATWVRRWATSTPRIRAARAGSKMGGQRVIEATHDDVDLEALFIDSVVVRVHQRAASAKKPGAQVLGCSRGKIHAMVDALGNPLRLILTGGEIADITQAGMLIKGLCAEAVVGDKGHDADAFVTLIHATGAAAVIPPRRNHIEQRTYGHHQYKD